MQNRTFGPYLAAINRILISFISATLLQPIPCDFAELAESVGLRNSFRLGCNVSLLLEKMAKLANWQKPFAKRED
jgi:hypothetical protein